jgi:hypothetical protein
VANNSRKYLRQRYYRIPKTQQLDLLVKRNSFQQPVIVQLYNINLKQILLLPNGENLSNQEFQLGKVLRGKSVVYTNNHTV